MWMKKSLYGGCLSFILLPDINSQQGKNIVDRQLNRTSKVSWTHLCLMFRMLHHYLDHKRKESSAPIHATYLVSGKSVDDGQMVRTISSHHRRTELHVHVCSCWWAVSHQGHRVSLVREDQLEGEQRPASLLLSWFLLLSVQILVVIVPWSWNVDWCFCFAEVKSRMSLVVSVHVYSVQKALLKDSAPLYSVDYDAVKDNQQNFSRSQFRHPDVTRASEPCFHAFRHLLSAATAPSAAPLRFLCPLWSCSRPEGPIKLLHLKSSRRSPTWTETLTRFQSLPAGHRKASWECLPVRLLRRLRRAAETFSRSQKPLGYPTVSADTISKEDSDGKLVSSRLLNLCFRMNLPKVEQLEEQTPWQISLRFKLQVSKQLVLDRTANLKDIHRQFYL